MEICGMEDLGYINVADITFKAVTEDGPVEVSVPLLSTPDGFEILRRCPLSFGQLGKSQIEALGEEKEIELRREEHRWLLAKIERGFPESFRPVLARVPYFSFLRMVDLLLRGERERTEAEIVRDYGKDSAQHVLWRLTHANAEPEPAEKKTEASQAAQAES